MRNRLPELLPGNTTLRTDVVMEASLKGAAPELLARIGFQGKQLLLVSDANTHAALGKRLLSELAAFSPRVLTLQGDVHADEAALTHIRAIPCDALIAVGSGTISDLCKYASYTGDKPYAVFPTAPSMNGYLSANASVTLQAVKESRPAHLPQGVFCDCAVIAAAPTRLIQSGLGDSLCRSTAQADWLLSHLTLGTPYLSEPFTLLMPYEAELFAQADRLITGDPSVVELLMRTLLVSGLGMTLAGGSYPASQGEHLIAHTMEMKHGSALPHTFHGEQIGVTTLTMARIQQEKLLHPLRLPNLPPSEQALTGYFGSALGRRIAESSAVKYRLYERFEAIAYNLSLNDLYIRERLRQVTLPESALHAVLHKAQAPMTPADLGWNEADYDLAVSRARFTRDRFTFLDV